jgi:hypothetical protein
MEIKLIRTLIGAFALGIISGCQTGGKQDGEDIKFGGNIFHAKGLIAPGEYQKGSSGDKPR